MLQRLHKAGSGDAEAERQVKKEALLQIGGAVAHELNNALTAILGNLQSLSDNMRAWDEAPPQVARSINFATRGAIRVRAFAGRLQAATGHQPLDPKRIAVSQLVDRLLPDIRGAMDKSLQLRVELADGLWDIRADLLQLEIAIQNLAMNAVEAMPDGGELGIAFANAMVDAASGELALAPGRYVVLTVTDTGTGMSEDVRARAFELFFSTKSGGQRLGLGLTQVQNQAMLAGGGVRLSSESGKGTRVELYLPAAEAGASNGETATPDRQADGATILVVEDDGDVREYVVEALESLRHTVIAVDHAQKALSYLELAPDRFDLLLTDGNLPGMDGYTLVRKVKAELPALAVLVMSASPHESLAGYRPEDRVEFLAKPMTKAALHQKIAGLLHRRSATPR